MVLGSSVEKKLHQGDWNELVKTSFRNVIVLVLTAEWLGSAHILETNVKEVVAGQPSVSLYIADVEDAKVWPEKLSDFEPPALLIMKDGKIKSALSGLISQRKIKQELREIRRPDA